MPNPIGGQSALEKAAIAARERLLPKNYYNNFSSANNYTSTHTRAVADDQTPTRGKGTGNFLDVNNYEAGDSLDIHGNVIYNGSGRNQQMTLNQATWGFGPQSRYAAPDMTGNVGQVVVG